MPEEFGDLRDWRTIFTVLLPAPLLAVERLSGLRVGRADLSRRFRVWQLLLAVGPPLEMAASCSVVVCCAPCGGLLPLLHPTCGI